MDFLISLIGFLLLAVFGILLVLALLAGLGILAAGRALEGIFDLVVPGRKTGLGARGIVDEVGVVVREVSIESTAAPEGSVRVAGEIWRAAARGVSAIPVGTRVRIVAVEGMVAFVEPIAEA